MGDFVLKGNICYSVSKTEIKACPHSYIVCMDGKSCGVFEKLPQQYESLPLIDYGNRLIIPGMVDLHIHAPQYAFRGMGMDLELMGWLQEQAFPEEVKYEDLDYACDAYSIFAEQMRKSATTRACIFATRHWKATVLLMNLMEETGLITYVGKVNMDRQAPQELCEEDVEQAILDTRKWLEKNRGKYRNTMPILTPRFLPGCSEPLLEKLQEVRKEYDLPVQSHLSENPEEVESVKKLFPNAGFYGDTYHKYGFFGNDAKTIMAHCVWSTEEEVECMRGNGVFVAHCPASNMNLASGIAPIKRYLELGIKVGLGSDVAGGQNESIFRAMTDAIQVSKLYWRYVDSAWKPLTFEEVFYMATKGGGEFFGKVGSFEEGYELDAIVLDDSMQPYPQELSLRQRLERSIYLSIDLNGIYAKYVAGKKVKCS
ncbi:MAG: amidohydrolase family protein [Lachnospiraceae bacterium]|nr:amidohydrolase family protein [Lachnospiraceae bacterium]